MRWQTKDRREHGWREWYAWYPVRVDGEWVWLETVERWHDGLFYQHRNWHRKRACS